MNSTRTRFAEQSEGFDSPLNAALAARDRSTLDMVAQAVRHKQCLLAFQPVVQARAPHNVAFYEGLIRILDETGRVIPARDFMPVVENTELGREIDCLALDTGLQALMQHPTLRLSVNMSARSIGYSRWMQTLNSALRRDERLGERACAFVTLTDGASLSLDDVRVWMDEHKVAKQYWPERIEIIQAIPRTPSGKIQKFMLRDMLQS